MSKYCPKCHSVYADDKNCCPKDGQKLEERSVEEQFRADLSVVRNKICWHMPPGVAAYCIDEADMESLLHVDGIVVNEGTIAYIYINGTLATTISGGVYNFIDVNDPEYQRRLTQRFGGVLQQIKGIWKVLTRFWVGTSLQDRIGDRQRIENYKTPDELEDAIRDNMVCSVILMANGEFPLILKTNLNNGYYNGQVALNLSIQITDFHQFLRKLLNGQKHLATSSLSKQLTPILNNALCSEIFRNGTVDAEVMRHILANMQAGVDALQCGISVVRVNDCAIQSEDLERLRNLDREINLSEEEITRIQHIRTIKDRLVEDDNRRKIAEARTQLDVAIAMRSINHDRIISNDEELAFTEAITLSRQLRQYDNSEKLAEAAYRIEKAGILRRNEIAILLADVNKQKYVRDNEFAMLQLSDAIERKRIEQQAIGDLRINQARNDVEITRINDAYQDERFYKELEFDKLRFQQTMEQQKQLAELKQQQEENAIKNDGSRVDIINKIKDGENRRTIELLKATTDNEVKIIKEKGDIEIRSKEITADMSAEQILAARVSLPTEAAVALAQNIGKGREAEAKIEAMKEFNEKLAELQESRVNDLKQAMSEYRNLSTESMATLERVSRGTQERERVRAEEYRDAKQQVEERIDRQQEAMIDHVLSPAAPRQAPQPMQPPKEEKLVTCPDCGTVNDVRNGSYCGKCGKRLV